MSLAPPTPQPPPAAVRGGRVLVRVNARGGATLVRYGQQLAERLGVPWTAAYVETPAAAQFSEAARDRVAEALREAARRGGQAVTIPAAGIADGLLEYAHANGFGHIVTSTTRRSWWETLLRRSATFEIIRRAGEISVHVVPEAPNTPPLLPPFETNGYFASLAYAAAALAAGFVLNRVFGIANVGLVFLFAILASAMRHGLWPALLASVVTVAAFNFLFMPPFYTFTIANPDDIVVLVTFTVIALIASNLTARMRAQALVARERATVTESLYQFSAKLASVYALDDLLWATAYQVARMLNVRVVILLAENGRLVVRAGYPPEDRLEPSETAAAEWVWHEAEPAGRGSERFAEARRLYLPMRTGRTTIGVIGLDGDKLLTPDQRRLFDALADQAALAIERVRLADDIEKSRLAAETEKLRGALLTSISHDLRTPLAVILGSASSLKDFGAALDPAAHRELVATIEEEGQRLNRFIANLLDMTRLESGALTPRFEPTDVGDVAGSAAARAARVLAGHKLEMAIEPDLPLVRLDPVLFEQALFNLLDNAGKYAPPGTAVSLAARRQGNAIRLEVADRGPGIPPADLERIFDKFYRVQAADRKRASTGLGLAIARGFVEAMGGTLAAGNRDTGGAVFVVTLPVETP